MAKYKFPVEATLCFRNPTFFSSSSIVTLKRKTSLTTTSSFLYRIWKVLLQRTSSWTEAGNARSEPRWKPLWLTACYWSIIQILLYIIISGGYSQPVSESIQWQASSQKTYNIMYRLKKLFISMLIWAIIIICYKWKI